MRFWRKAENKQRDSTDVKTITVDLDAHKALSQKPGQSFSQVSKEPRKSIGDLLAILKDVRVSEETLDVIEAQIRARRERAPPESSSCDPPAERQLSEIGFHKVSDPPPVVRRIGIR
jgi:predicted CopG family antitoxin